MSLSRLYRLVESGVDQFSEPAAVVDFGYGTDVDPYWFVATCRRYGVRFTQRTNNGRITTYLFGPQEIVDRIVQAIDAADDINTDGL